MWFAYHDYFRWIDHHTTEAIYNNLDKLNTALYDNLDIINNNMNNQHSEVRSTLERQHSGMMDILSVVR